MDIDAIEQAAVERIRSIRQSPLGLQMRPLADHLAFKTVLSANECMACLWYASQDRRASNGIAALEFETRVQ